MKFTTLSGVVNFSYLSESECDVRLDISDAMVIAKFKKREELRTNTHVVLTAIEGRG
jgi:hypothetical protein